MGVVVLPADAGQTPRVVSTTAKYAVYLDADANCLGVETLDATIRAVKFLDVFPSNPNPGDATVYELRVEARPGTFGAYKAYRVCYTSTGICYQCP